MTAKWLDTVLAAAFVVGGFAVGHHYGGAADLAAPLPGPEDAVTPAPPRTPLLACVRLTFAPGGRAHRFSAHVAVDAPLGALSAESKDLPPSAIEVLDGAVRVEAAVRAPSTPSLLLHVSPPGAPLRWSLEIDGAPLAPERVFAGPFGLSSPALVAGLASLDAWRAAVTPLPALVDGSRELGVFVAASCDDGW